MADRPTADPARTPPPSGNGHGGPTTASLLDAAPLSTFHLRSVLTSGMGFFTDAYDLFVIGTVTLLLQQLWHLDDTRTAALNSAALLGAFVGACVFGRVADLVGRKFVYVTVVGLMIAGALGSALSPSFGFLVAFRGLLGFGIGGDYPVSAVLTSEYANVRDRGKLVGLVFSMQALGIIVGPVVALTLLSAGASHELAWRLLLGLGAVPATLVLFARLRMPESPRYNAAVRGDALAASRAVSTLTRGALRVPTAAVRPVHRLRLRALVRNRRLVVALLGTAGSWFAFDYAYYGNSVSSPVIVRQVLGAHATVTQALAFNLIVFALAAVPGYYLAVFLMDRIGHRRLQLLGFPLMGLALLLLGAVPVLTTVLVPFLLLFGMSYFFAEFGPNTTTFVLAAEVFPTSARTTGHGLSAGIAKLGAFIGVYLFPVLTRDLGLRGSLLFSAGFALAGTLLTLCIPNVSGRSLEDTDAPAVVAAAEQLLIVPPPTSLESPSAV